MPKLLSIGAHETKTHLADLLRKVRGGQGIAITQRGEPVADLLPAGTRGRRVGKEAALRMQTFMAEAPSSGPCDIESLRNDGRD